MEDLIYSFKSVNVNNSSSPLLIILRRSRTHLIRLIGIQMQSYYSFDEYEIFTFAFAINNTNC